MSGKNNGVTWKVIAYALGFILWAIIFGLICWLCHSVNQLQQDMAVVKHQLGLPAVGYVNTKTNE